jgi:hypothetical protein
VVATCCRPSRLLHRILPKHLISKLLRNNRHREASRLLHMARDSNIIHISSQWHQPLHPVCHSLRTVT